MESGFLTFILVSSFAVYSSHAGIRGMKKNSKCIFAAPKTDIVGTGAYISQLMLLLACKHELTCFLEGRC